MNKNDDFKDSDKIKNEFNQIQTSKKLIRARGDNQSDYLSNIMLNDLTFGIGPAGTGKTYLAVASAIKALENEDVHIRSLVNCCLRFAACVFAACVRCALLNKFGFVVRSLLSTTQ